ncbi:MAG: 2OG-Fe(II) oxygenase [Methyloligellaceae bacterium]
MINFDAIRRTDVTQEPFKFFTTPGVLSAVDLAAIREDFPDIRGAGIFPLSELSYGPAFARLIDDITGSDLEDIMSEKYGVDLSDKPLMITVRGEAQEKDGRIHTDTKVKLVTCLLYLNDIWDESGGRLRFLRSPDNIEDFITEAPPSGGTLVSFLRSDNSWHGHKPYVGERRYVMFNWMTSQMAMDRELGRHRFSAKIKQLNPFTSRG